MRGPRLALLAFLAMMSGRRLPPAAAADSATSPFSAAGQPFIVGVAAGRCRDAAVSFGVEDGPAGAAQFDEPAGLAVVGPPELPAVLVADRRNLRIRRVADGAVASVSGRANAGVPTPGYADGSAAATEYMSPADISASPDGAWAAILDKGRVRRLDLASGISSTITGAVGTGFADGAAHQATFYSPKGLAVSPDGTWIAVADAGNNAVRRVDIASAETSTLVGLETCTPSCSTSGCQPTCERTGSAAGAGFADGLAPQKFKEVLAEVCSTATTNADARAVELVAPDATQLRLTLTVLHRGALKTEIDASRQLFVDESSSFIGQMATRLSLDASRISIVCSSSTAQDCSGSPPLLPMGNSTRVRMLVSNVDPARVKAPSHLAFSTDGELLVISDTGNNAVRLLNLASLSMSTVAGNGEAGLQDGPAAKAQLTAPGGVALSSDNRIILVAEAASHSIRRIDLESGIISTLSGNGTASALNGEAAASTFRSPADVAFGPRDAWAVVADTGNNCIRNISIVSKSFTGATPSPYSAIVQISIGAPSRRWGALAQGICVAALVARVFA